MEAGRESPLDLIVTRTRIFDELVERSSADVEQLVLLGAGFDTRAYGDLRLGAIDVFEVDRAATQNLKQRALHEARIDCDGVTYVPVDFSRDDLFARLEEAGFDRSKRTAFLWEGVTLYLTGEQVRAALCAISAKAAAGSVLFADLYAERLLRPLRRGPARRVLAMTGEVFRFGLPFDAPRREIETLADRSGLDVEDIRFLGGKRRGGPFLAIVSLEVPGRRDVRPDVAGDRRGPRANR